MTGIQILTNCGFTDLRLAVEIAFGVPPGTDGPWTDVSNDLQASGVNIVPGRGDESETTQPAQCGFTLKNTSGFYSRGPQSGNPGLRMNIPIRVRILLNGTPDLEFQGEADGFTPSWDTTGNYATAIVKAYGTLKRVEAGDDVLHSAMYRYILAQSGVVAHWPMEEGSTATAFASAIDGGPAMTSSTGLPKPSSYSGFVASAGAPTLGAERFTASCGGTTITTGGGQIWMLVSMPATALTDGTRIASINVACANLTHINLLYNTAFSGGFSFIAYNGTTSVASIGAIPVNGGANGQPILLGLTWEYSSSLLALDLREAELAPAYSGTSSSSGVTAGTAPITGVNSIIIAPDASCSGMSVGHLYLTSAIMGLGPFDVPDAAVAFVGETATDRITRLCAEQGVPVTVTGTSLQTMGPQGIGTFSALLRECESVDVGVLYDGAGPGLSYIARDSRENQQPTLVLDAAAGDIVACSPVDDDLGIINRFVATRVNGSSATFTDTTSALAAANIGDKPGTGELNCESDDTLYDYAAFRVNLGEVDDYRYPSLLLAIHSAPRILPGWLATGVSSRIDVKNLADVRISQDPKDLSLMVEGWNQTITREAWTIAVNCTSYDPWRVAVWANTTGDNSEFIGRYEPDAATVSGPVAAGAITLTVATPSGPPATTAADDFPMDLDVGGLRVTCTSVTGASSPQTFHVNATTMRIPDQAPVTIWRNPRLTQ